VADQIAVVDFTTPATADPTALNITSPDITETVRAIVLIWGNSVNEDADETPARMGMAAISLDAFTAAESLDTLGGTFTTILRNGQATPAGAIGTGNDTAVLLLTDASSGFTIISEVSAVIAGGVTLSFTTVTGGAQVQGKAIIFAGDSMRSWGGLVETSSTTPTQFDVGPTVPGDDFFQPDLVIVMPTLNSLDAATRSGNGEAGFGCVVSGAQVSASVNFRAGVEPSEVDGVVRSARGNCCFRDLARTQCGHTFALNADGFEVTAATTNGTRGRYLAIKFGGLFNVGAVNESVSGSTGVQNFTGLGFTPDVVLGFSTLMTSLDTLTEDETAAAGGYFIASSGASRAASIREEEAHTGVSVVSARQGDHALLTLDHLGAVAHQATWNGGISGGFSLNFSTATAGKMTLLGIGLALAPVVTTETVEISDSVIAFLNRTLVLTETVEISDAVVLDTMDVSDTEGPQGWTYEARAERGTALSGGAEAGTVL